MAAVVFDFVYFVLFVLWHLISLCQTYFTSPTSSISYHIFLLYLFFKNVCQNLIANLALQVKVGFGVVQ